MARIAVVDDLDFNRDLVAALLRPAGHDIVEAADGAAALEMVRRERPELIVCDVLMPVMDGYEFVRRLRSDPVCGEYGARGVRQAAVTQARLHQCCRAPRQHKHHRRCGAEFQQASSLHDRTIARTLHQPVERAA